jgi:hypothetical protein
VAARRPASRAKASFCGEIARAGSNGQDRPDPDRFEASRRLSRVEMRQYARRRCMHGHRLRGFLTARRRQTDDGVMGRRVQVCEHARRAQRVLLIFDDQFEGKTGSRAATRARLPTAARAPDP